MITFGIIISILAWFALGIKVGLFIKDQQEEDKGKERFDAGFKVGYQDGYGDGFKDGRKS